MKTIGLLGGMSWESSVYYERIINSEVQQRRGGVHSADLLIRSYDFGAIERMQQRGAWQEAGELLAADAAKLEAAGAELIVLCTNTMHKVADSIEAAIGVPFLHLGDAAAAAVAAKEIQVVGLLGTRYTMEQDFYRDRLEGHGLKVLVPEEPDRSVVHDVIYNELVKGIVSDGSKRAYLDIIERLLDAGAEGVIAACTEIELLVGPEDVECPYFPTTRLHAVAAVEAALAGD